VGTGGCGLAQPTSRAISSRTRVTALQNRVHGENFRQEPSLPFYTS
jgi:hypothetical protein